MAEYKKIAEAIRWPFGENDLITFLKAHTLSDAGDGYLKCLTCKEIINISGCMDHVNDVKHMDSYRSNSFTEYLSSHGITPGNLPGYYFCRLCAIATSNREDIMSHIDGKIHQIEISMRNVDKSKSDSEVLIRSVTNFITHLNNSEVAKSENLKRILPAIDKSLLNMEAISENLKRFQDFDRRGLDVSAESGIVADLGKNIQSNGTSSVSSDENPSDERILNSFFKANSLKSVGSHIQCEICNLKIAKNSLSSLLGHINGKKHSSNVFNNDKGLILSSQGILANAEGTEFKCYYCAVVLNEQAALLHVLMETHQSILLKKLGTHTSILSNSLENPVKGASTYSSKNDSDPDLAFMKKFGTINKITILDKYYHCDMCNIHITKDADNLLSHINGKKHTGRFEVKGTFISFLESHTITQDADGLFECFLCKIIGMDGKLAAYHPFEHDHVFKLLSIMKCFC